MQVLVYTVSTGQQVSTVCHGANVMCSVASLEANHFVFLMFAFGYVHGIKQLEGHVLKAKCGV